MDDNALTRSRTTPAEDFLDLVDDDPLISSYNYYCFYHTQKPFNPRLHKPKYKPEPNYNFIKEEFEEFSMYDEKSKKKYSIVSNDRKDSLIDRKDSLNEQVANLSLIDSTKNENCNLSFLENTKKPDLVENEGKYNNFIINNYQMFNTNNTPTFNQNNNFYNYQNPYFNPGLPKFPFFPVPDITKVSSIHQINQMQYFQPSYLPNFTNYHQSVQSDELYQDPQIYQEMIQNPVEYGKNFQGSKLLQDFLPNASFKDIQTILHKVIPSIFELSEDGYGNYFIQKIIEVSDSRVHILIYQQFKGKFFNLAIDMHGCRVVQTLISFIPVEFKSFILDELKNDLLECILNKNGNHVVQRLIQELPNSKYEDIIKVCENNAFELSINQYGCRVIQRIFEFGSEDSKSRIQSKLQKNLVQMINDEYGNYVVQHIVEKRREDNKIVFDLLDSKVAKFCLEKHASNVIEKCLKYGSIEQIQKIIQEVLDSGKLYDLVRDKFGNYCIQKMIDFSPKVTQILLIKAIAKLKLKRTEGYAKHIFDFIEKKGYPRHHTPEFISKFG